MSIKLQITTDTVNKSAYSTCVELLKSVRKKLFKLIFRRKKCRYLYKCRGLLKRVRKVWECRVATYRLSILCNH